MAAASKANSETSRGSTWKESDVFALLDLMKEETISLNLDGAKTPTEKRAAYNEVKVQLENRGIKYGLDAVINKWKKLKQQFKKEVDKSRRSGTERRKKWKFFDDMEEICGHRDNISPSVVLDSSKGDGNSPEDELNDPQNSEHDMHSIPIPESEEANKITSEDKDTQEDLGVPEKESGGEEKNVRKRDPATLGITKKNTKQTKMEKSLEMLCMSFKETSEMEMEQHLKIEEERHKREMDFQLKLKQMENERRREERQHELSVLQLISQQSAVSAFPVRHNFGHNYHDGFGVPAPSNSSSSDAASSYDGNTSFYQM